MILAWSPRINYVYPEPYFNGCNESCISSVTLNSVCTIRAIVCTRCVYCAIDPTAAQQDPVQTEDDCYQTSPEALARDLCRQAGPSQQHYYA